MHTSALRAVATDLDGTLLHSDGTLSSRTRDALAQARTAGLLVVLVSARPPSFVRLLAAQARLTGYAICCNGAILYDLAADQIAEYHPVPLARVPLLITTLRAHVPGISFGWVIGLEFGCEPAYAALRPPGRPPPAALGDALELCIQPPANLVARHATLRAEDLLASARPLAGGALALTHSDPFLLEISAAGVDKGAALAGLCALRGIPPAAVMAFGDMPNDLPMLVWAGHSVAVANAHPTVLAAADEITLSNDEDGVALVIERTLSSAIRRQQG